MQINDIEKLIEIVSKSELSGFEIEQDGCHLRLYKNGYQADNKMVAETEAKKENKLETKLEAKSEIVADTGSENASFNAVTPAEVSKTGKEVKSPLVGVFYAAPAEDKAPYVTVGDHVKKGQIIGIVEAMKLMNEIESDYEGIVADILVENGQAVEYGQVLVKLS